MPTNKIRWSNKDENELKREVRNFNARIDRALKNNPEATYLPEKKSIKTERTKAQQNSRRDFKQQIKWLDKARAENLKEVKTASGIRTSQFELARLKELTRRENIKKANKRKSDKTEYLKGLDDPEKIKEFKPTKFNIESKTPMEFSKWANALEKRMSSKYTEESLDLFYSNYIKGTYELGIYGEYIRLLADDMSNEDLFKLSQEHQDLFINFMYEPQEQLTKANQIIKLMKKYAKPETLQQIQRMGDIEDTDTWENDYS